MPKVKRPLVDTQDVLGRLSDIKVELAHHLADQGVELRHPPADAFATRTPGELLHRAAVLKRLIATFHPFSAKSLARFHEDQQRALESMLASTIPGSRDFAGCLTSWIFEVARATKVQWTQQLLALDAMLPGSRQGRMKDPDALQSLEQYLLRNTASSDRELVICEMDLRLTRLSQAGCLNALTAPFYVAFLFVESGYPRIWLPERSLTEAALRVPERYPDLLMAYARHALYSLAGALALLLLEAKEWPSSAAFYSDPDMDLALATLREGLLVSPCGDPHAVGLNQPG